MSFLRCNAAALPLIALPAGFLLGLPASPLVLGIFAVLEAGAVRISIHALSERYREHV